MNKSPFALIPAFFLTAGLASVSLAADARQQPEPHSTAQAVAVCSEHVDLPQNREELDSFDVVTALRNYFIRIGQPEVSIRSEMDEEADLVVATAYNPAGQPVRVFEVDTASATILSDIYFPITGIAVQASGEPGTDADYVRRLRRHLAGDGQPWAEWIGSHAIQNPCIDDYRDGGPILPGR